jgi:hypothetical protein
MPCCYYYQVQALSLLPCTAYWNEHTWNAFIIAALHCCWVILIRFIHKQPMSIWKWATAGIPFGHFSAKIHAV